MLPQRQDSDGGFEKFMQHFQSEKQTLSSSQDSATPESSQQASRDRDVTVEYSKTSGFPWYLVIDTPGGHGEPLSITTGIETTPTELAEEDYDFNMAHPIDFSEIDRFPAFEVGPESSKKEEIEDSTTISSSQEEGSQDSMCKEDSSREAPKKEEKQVKDGYEPLPWPSWVDEKSSSTVSSVSPSVTKVSSPVENTNNEGNDVSPVQPLHSSESEKIPEKLQGEDNDDFLLEGFGHRPTRRLVGARKKLRKLLGAEAIQTYGEPSARKRIGNYRCWKLLCCRYKGDKENDEAYDPYDFGVYDEDPEKIIEGFRKSAEGTRAGGETRADNDGMSFHSSAFSQAGKGSMEGGVGKDGRRGLTRSSPLSKIILDNPASDNLASPSRPGPPDSSEGSISSSSQESTFRSRSKSSPQASLSSFSPSTDISLGASNSVELSSSSTSPSSSTATTPSGEVFQVDPSSVDSLAGRSHSVEESDDNSSPSLLDMLSDTSSDET